MSNLPVLIVGGGIGGLTAALCFAQRGFDVHLFEKSSEFGEVGAGIQLSPNCSRVLHSLELEWPLQAASFLPETAEVRHYRSGQVMMSNPLGSDIVSRYGFPYYHVHRADLLQVLLSAAKRINSIQLHTDSELRDFEQTDSSVNATFGEQQFTGQLLLGADGIHSTVRANLFGAERARFTGNIAWRTTIPAARLANNPVRPASTAWFGPKRHFVHYYVRGGALVNCIGVVEKSGWEYESWTERGELDEFRSDFSGWHHDLTALFGAMDAGNCYKWALFDRKPMRHWSKGRVTLLGDACHPTLPFMAQGAAMAIEDAAVLATVMASEQTVTQALARYESLRRVRTRKIQQGSRRNARVFHAEGFKAWARNRVMGVAASWQAHQLYRYDALNAGLPEAWAR